MIDIILTASICLKLKVEIYDVIKDYFLYLLKVLCVCHRINAENVGLMANCNNIFCTCNELTVKDRLFVLGVTSECIHVY